MRPILPIKFFKEAAFIDIESSTQHKFFNLLLKLLKDYGTSLIILFKIILLPEYFATQVRVTLSHEYTKCH